MNPFLSLQKLKLIEISKKKQFTANENLDDGVIVSLNNSLTFTNNFRIEQDKKITLYKIPYVRSLMLGLSPCTLRLFIYISYTLKENQDLIHLPHKKVCKNLEVSMPTYYKAITELMDNQILAKQKREYYWINPAFLFNGNRIRFFEEHCPDCIDVVARL